MYDILRKYKLYYSGNTLIEIIVAIAILGIGIISVVGIYPVGLSYIRGSSEKVFAIQQAQAIMEALKSSSYDQLVSLYSATLSGGYYERDPLEDTNGFEHKGFKSRIQVTRSTIQNALLLKVCIKWQEKNRYARSTNIEKEYVLETVKSNTTPR